MNLFIHRYRTTAGILLFFTLIVSVTLLCISNPEVPGTFAGSSSCKQCHERFYDLWEPSFHGKAMQPFTPQLARENLSSHKGEIQIDSSRYRALLDETAGWIVEKSGDKETSYPIAYAMGGKNVYYFLTSLERGKLQTLPLAYDVNRKEWFDMAGSGVRHFADVEDEPFHWTDWPYTFNSRCYSCHVSQYSGNYDLNTDTYYTTWREPGINCETCHGAAEEHNRLFLEAQVTGETPKDVKLVTITQSRGYTAHQVNASCAICHAKCSPITPSYPPGEDFFQHYDLATLEHSDYYPDGRDLGENYTYTTWLMSPCVRAGDLDCLHCHTSSGRYRFKEEHTNDACLPCHTEHVTNAVTHTHHPADGPVTCVSCHMPMTEFARMRRSDHSMLPPSPAATIRFKSPNACTSCHIDKSAEWADSYVQEWRKRDYQAPVIERTALIQDARQGNWEHLPKMLEYIVSEERDEVFANSLVRLLAGCVNDKKWTVFIEVLKNDPSPLVRSSAAAALGGNLHDESVAALLLAAKDPYRLVRIRAAESLSAVPPQMIDSTYRTDLEAAVGEYKTAMISRPDDAVSHYNLGNFFMNRRNFEEALSRYDTAVNLRDDFIQPLVNASLIYNIMGQNDKAEEKLRNALEIEPKNEAAHLNLGMLLGETGKIKEAEKAFRSALNANPESAQAAYNLGVLLSKDRKDEAVFWCGKAYHLDPGNPKYAYTLAFFLNQKGEQDAAIKILNEAINQSPNRSDVYLLLGNILEARGEFEQAKTVYRKAAENRNLSEQERGYFAARAAEPKSR